MMSKQQGRGGMGSRKHGTSGTPGPNRRTLPERAREKNQRDAELAELRARQKPKMGTPSEILGIERKKKKKKKRS